MNIASVSGTRPSPGTVAYGAAKAGLINPDRVAGGGVCPRCGWSASSQDRSPPSRPSCTTATPGRPGPGRADGPGRLGWATPRTSAQVRRWLTSPLASYERILGLVHGAGERPAPWPRLAVALPAPLAPGAELVARAAWVRALLGCFLPLVGSLRLATSTCRSIRTRRRRPSPWCYRAVLGGCSDSVQQRPTPPSTSRREDANQAAHSCARPAAACAVGRGAHEEHRRAARRHSLDLRCRGATSTLPRTIQLDADVESQSIDVERGDVERTTTTAKEGTRAPATTARSPLRVNISRSPRPPARGGAAPGRGCLSIIGMVATAPWDQPGVEEALRRRGPPTAAAQHRRRPQRPAHPGDPQVPCGPGTDRQANPDPPDTTGPPDPTATRPLWRPGSVRFQPVSLPGGGRAPATPPGAGAPASGCST